MDSFWLAKVSRRALPLRRNDFRKSARPRKLPILPHHDPRPFSFPMTTPTRADFDPLKRSSEATPTRDRTLSVDLPTSTNTNPISFKRRTPSKSSGVTKAGNLISNLLSTNNSERDVVPNTLNRPNAPSHVNLTDPRFRTVSESNFSQALDDDDEDEDDEIGSGDERLGGLDWKRRGRGGGQRLSFAQGTAPPRLVPPYTRNMASPSKAPGDGDGDGEGEEPIPFTVTPLPKIPMTVLYVVLPSPAKLSKRTWLTPHFLSCVALFGEFLSASISSPFLFLFVVALLSSTSNGPRKLSSIVSSL